MPLFQVNNNMLVTSEYLLFFVMNVVVAGMWILIFIFQLYVKIF